MAPPPRGLEPLLLDALRRAGAREVELVMEPPEEDRVRARWLLDPGAPPAEGADTSLRLEVEISLRATLPGVALDPRWRTFDPGLWLAQRGERTLGIPGIPPLVLLPGVAFGDGDHPTTRRCLSLLASLVTPEARVADVGSGSGLLTVAAALLGAREVVAVEMDRAGCDETAANARRNGVEERVRVVQHRVTPEDPGPLAQGGWSGIVANLEGSILRALVPGLLDALAPGGWLLVSGLHRGELQGLAEGAPGAPLESSALDDGWVTLLFRAAIRPPGPPPPHPG